MDIISNNITIIGNPGCGKTKTIIDYCINNFKNKSDSKSYRCKLCDDKARKKW